MRSSSIVLIYIDVLPSDFPEKPRWRELAVTLVSYPFEDIPTEWRFEVVEVMMVPESEFIPFDVATLTSSEWASFGLLRRSVRQLRSTASPMMDLSARSQRDTEMATPPIPRKRREIRC